MRTHPAALIAPLLLAALPAAARSHDWQRLADVPAGTRIVVKAGSSIDCILRQVDSRMLGCDSDGQSYDIPRDEVREVREYTTREGNHAVAWPVSLGIVGLLEGGELGGRGGAIGSMAGGVGLGILLESKLHSPYLRLVYRCP